VGWLRRPARAARLKPPACATAWKARKPEIDTFSPIEKLYALHADVILDR
jgi:hypothetical protein